MFGFVEAWFDTKFDTTLGRATTQCLLLRFLSYYYIVMGFLFSF
jgi:hypothetical protein